MVAQTSSRTRSPKGSRLSFQSSSRPAVDAAANVHEFSLVEGSVSVGAGAMIAPGTAVTAEPGASVVVGDRAQLLPGVIAEATCGAAGECWEWCLLYLDWGRGGDRPQISYP